VRWTRENDFLEIAGTSWRSFNLWIAPVTHSLASDRKCISVDTNRPVGLPLLVLHAIPRCVSYFKGLARVISRMTLRGRSFMQVIMHPTHSNVAQPINTRASQYNRFGRIGWAIRPQGLHQKHYKFCTFWCLSALLLSKHATPSHWAGWFMWRKTYRTCYFVYEFQHQYPRNNIWNESGSNGNCTTPNIFKMILANRIINKLPW
jgi:hypothetical protein